MENNLELLKYIYQEDLYIIDEPRVEHVQEAVVEEVQDQSQPDGPSKVEEQLPVKFLGRNEKGILVLVRDQDSELLNQTDLDFLMKVVESGLRFSKNDFALVNVSRFPVSQILEEVPYNYILSFGVDLELGGTDPSMYQVLDIDGNQVLFAHTLGEISLDQGRKKMLWNSLKSMFNIS